MSKHRRFQVNQIRDYPLESRKSKVCVRDLANPVTEDSFRHFVRSLPRILAAEELRELAARVRRARDAGRSIIWGFSGHLVKVGLAPVLVDLMQRGYVTALATNGSGLIHDFEMALCGATSEDVEAELQSGAFGMARETGEQINRAINRGSSEDLGIGESVGTYLSTLDPAYAGLSLLVQAVRLEIPLTVHVAFGTDIIHNHPMASGEAIGKGTQIDFQIFTQQVAGLAEGGVYLNVGSAVILPEVFLKAVSMVRNAGMELRNFSTANLDFLQHYRPLQNVVRRPVAGSGRGFALTGHHEIMIPLLAALLVLGD